MFKLTRELVPGRRHPDYVPFLEQKVREVVEQRENLMMQAYLKCLELGGDYVVVLHGPHGGPVFGQAEYAMPASPPDFREIELQTITICRESDIGSDYWPCTVYSPNQASAHQKMKFMAMVRAKMENPDALHP